MTVRRSVSLAISSAVLPGQVLLVQRPDDDADLPGLWGLPAASLAGGESWEDAVRRAARGKLGVDVVVGRVLGHGTQERAHYTLEMKLFEAAIAGGIPSVPQGAPGVTQYRAWCWGLAADLHPAAERGSLCSRLLLAAADRPGP
jgi:ADP-ribose pyrophosphatase YjhB (NUDIX family)